MRGWGVVMRGGEWGDEGEARAMAMAMAMAESSVLH